MSVGLYERPVFRLAGDRGLLVEFGDAIALAVNDMVRALALVLEKERPPGVREWIAAYRSLLVCYDPMETDGEELTGEISRLLEKMTLAEMSPPAVVSIPVCYGSEYGPDIEFVASHNNLTVSEVIRLHSEPTYRIYMLGFTPGFPFLGGLSDRLHTPRLTTPRLSVPAGSVGIANAQTGIYPISSPGGWQLIGRTPLKLFAPERENHFLLKAGDFVKFVPIGQEEFTRLARGEDG